MAQNFTGAGPGPAPRGLSPYLGSEIEAGDMSTGMQMINTAIPGSRDVLNPFLARFQNNREYIRQSICEHGSVDVALQVEARQVPQGVRSAFIQRARPLFEAVVTSYNAEPTPDMATPGGDMCADFRRQVPVWVWGLAAAGLVLWFIGNRRR